MFGLIGVCVVYVGGVQRNKDRCGQPANKQATEVLNCVPVWVNLPDLPFFSLPYFSVIILSSNIGESTICRLTNNPTQRSKRSSVYFIYKYQFRYFRSSVCLFLSLSLSCKKKKKKTFGCVQKTFLQVL